jgi:cyclohexyl-isocyanide hydratase
MKADEVKSSVTASGNSGASTGQKPALEIALLMYPGFFGQDLVGPYTVFALLPGARVHLVARSRDPIIATPGQLPMLPNATFDDCPRDLDLLLVPGGAFSTVNAMQDEATLAFVRDRGERARYVTSVCTGSLILGAAGLLQGYKATSHWLTWDLLTHFGATPTHGRVVVDRNRMTGGGVTAGIDFGLKIAAMLTSEQMAQAAQLIIEYDPQPPFDAGSPERAPAEVKRMVDERYAPFMKAVREAVAQLSQHASG